MREESANAREAAPGLRNLKIRASKERPLRLKAIQGQQFCRVHIEAARDAVRELSAPKDIGTRRTGNPGGRRRGHDRGR